jgi:methanogenic corrinoid protein MtbC1
MMAAEAADRLAVIVEEASLKAGISSLIIGTVILGQVEDDMHDIGRHCVSTYHILL